MCKERCVFECEDFPKENQKLANRQRPNGLTKISNVFYTVLGVRFYLNFVTLILL